MPRWGLLSLVIFLAGCATGTPVGMRFAGSSIHPRRLVPVATPEDQAVRQSNRVRGMGIRIEWHVAEKEAADAIRELFKKSNVEGVEIIHTPTH